MILAAGSSISWQDVVVLIAMCVFLAYMMRD